MAREAASIRSLKAYARRRYGTEDDVAAYISQLDNESERATIIIAATGVEDALEEALLKLMIPMDINSDIYRDLFQHNAPLTTFSAKTRLAHALKLIDDTTRDDIEIIRELRNACAHSRLPIAFDTPEVAILCNSLTLTDPVVCPTGVAEQTMRYLFSMKCLLIQAYLHRGVKISTHEDFLRFLDSDEDDDAPPP